MNTDILIRPILQGEEDAVCRIVERSFDMFVGCDYSLEGVAEFYKYANPTAMASRLLADHFILVAEHKSQVVGMIEWRDFNTGFDELIDGRMHARAVFAPAYQGLGYLSDHE